MDLNPSAVLSYLNDLGYYNITACQLKEFITDLKKLLKYEEQSSSTNVPQSKDKSITDQKTYKYSNKQGPVPNTSTISSSAKCVKKVNKQTENKSSMQTVKQKSDPPLRSVFRSNSVCLKNQNTQSKSDNKETNVHRCCSAQSLRSSKTADMKYNTVKKSFIRPRQSKSNQSVGVNDPVTLYHNYQAEWKKLKLPGESKHSDLRWSIRQRMLGEP